MLPEPSSCSCSALRQAARHLTRLYDAALSPAGLGLNQYAILARLARLGPTRLTDLAAHLVMDRSTLGHLLRPLQARALLAIRIDERDRRSRLIALTDAGDALRARAQPLWQTVETQFATTFGATEARTLRTACARVERIALPPLAA